MSRSLTGRAWVAAQFVLMATVALCGWLLGSPAVPRALRVTGWLLICVAVVVGSLGALALGANLRPSPVPAPHAQLVQAGIYAWLRHPLYTSVLAGFLGIGCVTGSWPALIVWLGLAGFLDAKARFEERLLCERFPGYEGYAKSVRRFIPGVY